MAQQAKGIGQALGHFAMAFGHMMFGDRPEGEEDGENEGQEDNEPRVTAGSCCVKRGGSKVKKKSVRSVQRGNRTE